MMGVWGNDEIGWLIKNYPQVGLRESARALERTTTSVRAKASKIGLKQDRTSTFFHQWQDRAGRTKVGKKRPAQAEVIRRLRKLGRLKPTPDGIRRGKLGFAEWLRINGHPRGALGMRHSAATRAVISAKSRKCWANKSAEEIEERNLKIQRTRVAYGLPREQSARRTWKAGWRTIGGIRKYYRSRWEANYARYLDWMKSRKEIKLWEHEPETFWFEGIRRGEMSYLPDFRVTEVGGSVSYHEVKGWMDAGSKTRLTRMAKYHPAITVVLIDDKAYRQIEKHLSPVIAGWERHDSEGGE